MAATVECLTFPSGEGGWRKAEAEESSLYFGSQSQRKRQKVKNVPTLKVTRVKKVMKVNTCLGELRRARDLWLEADKDEVTVVDSDEDRSGGVDLPDLKVLLILLVVERESELERALQLVQAVTASQSAFQSLSGNSSSSSSTSSSSSFSHGKRQKVKEVPSLREDRVDKAGQVIKFIHQFRMVMLAHAVSERDQKSYLLEAVHKKVTERLLVEGIENSLMTISCHWLRFLCWDHIGRGWCWMNGRGSGWWKMNRFSDSARESKCLMMHFLTNQCQWRDRILIYSELRLKFLVVMREMLKEEQPLFRCGKSWGDF